MIVEVQIDGLTQYRWFVNENEGIEVNVDEGFDDDEAWRMVVEMRQANVEKVVDTVWQEVVPNLNLCGHLEIFIVFESKFPDMKEENNDNPLRMVPLAVTPPVPRKERRDRAIPQRHEPILTPDPDRPRFIRPKAEYSNKQHASIQ